MTRFTLRRHDRLDSTSDEARRLAEAGAPHATAVIAREQTRGRGRQGRPWVSPPGNLHLSIVLRPAIPARRCAEPGFAAALAVAEAVEACLPRGRRAMLKWPNDILVNDAKLAGVLVESALHGREIGWMTLGIGVNVAHRPLDTPYAATSLLAEGAAATADDLADALLVRLEHWLACWSADGFAAVRAAWLTRAYRLGEAITVGQAGGAECGRFTGLDAQGALLLGTEAGTVPITTGDVGFG